MRHRSTMSSPLALPDCVAWYDAFDEASITKASNLVSQWNDRSGSALHQVQATGGNQPTYDATGLNSRPTITFTTGKGLGYGSNSLGQNIAGLTLIAVTSTSARTTVQRYAVILNNTAPQRASLSISDTSTTGSGDFSGGGRRLDADTFAGIRVGTITNNTPFIQCNVFDYANTDLFVYAGGTQQGSNTSFQAAGNTSNTASAGFFVGAASAAQATPLLGSISELIVYHRALSTAEQRRVEWYLSRKWNISVV